MPHSLPWIDRLRIERVVWCLDQRLYDLPRESRIAKRREVRQNLIAARGDVGVAAAIRHLGDIRQLAAEYRSAEFGDVAPPSWFTAAVFLLTGQLILNSMLGAASSSFAEGIRATNPAATGAFRWHGIDYLQSSVSYTFTNGEWTSVGGAWTPVAWVVWIAATIAIGRLWRIVPIWRRRHRARAAGMMPA